MESERIKDIKKCIEVISNAEHYKQIKPYLTEAITYINELESVNEKLTEERDLYKKQFNELKPRFFDLRDDNKELKNRIADLENGIAKSMLGCEFLPECTNEKLKQFAEKVKMEFYYQFDEIIPSIMADKIDKILKEFLSK